MLYIAGLISPSFYYSLCSDTIFFDSFCSGPKTTLNSIFKSAVDEFPFLISNYQHDKKTFKAQCYIDSGSSFQCILTRRKIAQLGLKCRNYPPERANCGGGIIYLYLYEPVCVEFLPLCKKASLDVYGVSPEDIRKEYPDFGSCQATSQTSATGEGPHSSPVPGGRRKSSRISCQISPCRLNKAALIDAEILIGLPGLEKLGLVLDFPNKCIREAKSMKVARTR